MRERTTLSAALNAHGVGAGASSSKSILSVGADMPRDRLRWSASARLRSDGAHDCFDSIGSAYRIFVFPCADYLPSGPRECSVVALVARSVAGDLRASVVTVCPRLRAVLWAAMPVAAINEDRDSFPHEDNVRSNGVASEPDAPIEPVAQTSLVKLYADRELRSRVSAPVPDHHCARGLAAGHGRRWQRWGVAHGAQSSGAAKDAAGAGDPNARALTPAPATRGYAVPGRLPGPVQTRRGPDSKLARFPPHDRIGWIR